MSEHGPPEQVDHPLHYGGEDDPYEAIKVIEAWDLGFHLGNTIKYIVRAGLKNSDDFLTDLQKARWYLDRYVTLIERIRARADTRLQEPTHAKPEPTSGGSSRPTGVLGDRADERCPDVPSRHPEVLHGD